MNAAILFLIVLFLVMKSQGKIFGGEKRGGESPPEVKEPEPTDKTDSDPTKGETQRTTQKSGHARRVRVVRVKYAERYREGTNTVKLDEDVAKDFPDSKSVNETLRSIPGIIERCAKSLHDSEGGGSG